MQDLAKNHAQLSSAIQASCRSAGRPEDSVRLIAVTKTVEPEVAAELFALGCHDLGENRLAEFERKHAWFEERGLQPRWHFIGHIQRNKARRIARLAHTIHSVDSLRLLETLNQVAGELDHAPGLYLQVKLNDEPSKGGLAPEELPAALELAAAPGALPLVGLMTMAPLDAAGPQLEAAERTFLALAELAKRLPREAFQGEQIRLSMGMSGDFGQAIHAGANDIRVGSALFRDHQPSLEGPEN